MNIIESSEILLLDHTQHVMQDETAIRNIIEQGTDAEFDEMKKFLLDPKNFVKDNCLRLSGVSSMIYKLSDEPEGSDLRAFLVKEVTHRIRDVFGSPLEDSLENMNAHDGPNQLDILSIWNLNIRQQSGENYFSGGPDDWGQRAGKKTI